MVPADAIEALAPADRALWDAMGEAVPTWSVMPTPGAQNELGSVRAVCEAIGTPLLPWQAWAVRVITEKRIEDPRRYRFPEFTLTVERQSGKTTLVRGVLLARSIMRRHRLSAYSAQTGKDAGERWSELCERVVNCPALASKFKVRRAAGTQRLTCMPTESRIFPFAPTETSLHGYTPHDVALDEIFAFDDAQGTSLLGAIKPAQQTVIDRQLLMFSTAGHAESTFLKGRVDMGRAATSDPAASVGYCEWSFPDGADVYAEETWRHHPALGYLITIEDMRELAATTPPGEWRRAFANQWVEAFEPLFDMVRWAELAAPLTPVPLADCAVGFAVDSRRTRAAVVAAWALPDGRQAVKIVHSTHEVDRLAELVRAIDDKRPLWIGADNGGLNRGVLDQVRRGLSEHRAEFVNALTASDWVIASTGLVGKIADGTIVHDGGDVLTKAVEGALSRPLGEAWALSHNSPPEALAMAAALRGLDSKKRAAPAPFIYIPGEGAA